MLTFIIRGVSRVFDSLTRYAPGLRLLARLQRRHDLKWGVPAMLVSVPYFIGAEICKRFIEDGSELWVALPMLWCLVIGFVFLVNGPKSLFRLAVARIREANAARQQRRAYENADMSELMEVENSELEAVALPGHSV